MHKAALLSVSDKTGLDKFAAQLVKLGYTLLASGGTKEHLKSLGFPVTGIEDYTGQKEILSGRVKTLHPKIHGGILARMDDPEHRAELQSAGIMPIEVVVVNLYPFTQNLSGASATDPLKMIELVDVGGPTMLRAAAKNHRYVLPVIDPSDYQEVGAKLEAGHVEIEDRRKLAAKVFASLSAYDLAVAKYFSGLDRDPSEFGSPNAEGVYQGAVLVKDQSLRYGENPHQKAALYSVCGEDKKSWRQLQGKDLSYNNLLDFDATLQLVRALKSSPVAVIIKHLNPCGVASHGDLLQALRNAKRGDPRSHFGGIIGFSREVGREVAQEIREDFAEIVCAPKFSTEALAVLAVSKNLRVIEVDLEAPDASLEYRVVEGGMLVQQRDPGVSDLREASIPTKRQPTPAELEELNFAWTICAHAKSNAIVVTKDKTLLAVGTGQMSRVDSAEVAVAKAKTHGHDLKGAVAASDAFFPFPDAMEHLMQVGVTAICAPGGAKRDPDSVAAADRFGAALLFTADRHFKH